MTEILTTVTHKFKGHTDLVYTKAQSLFLGEQDSSETDGERKNFRLILCFDLASGLEGKLRINHGSHIGEDSGRQ